MGAAFMALAVIIGAFGAHALKARLSPEMHQVFEVGVRYHIYHALGMFVIAWLASVRSTPLLNGAGCCFVAGLVFFSGALYLYALTGIKSLAMLAPIGGSFFIAGWVMVCVAASPTK